MTLYFVFAINNGCHISIFHKISVSFSFQLTESSSCLRAWFVWRSLCPPLPRRRPHRVTIILTNDLGHESKSQFNPAFCSHRGLFCLHNPRDWSRQTRPSTWAFHLNMMVMRMQYLLPQNQDNADNVDYENDNNDSNEKDNDVLIAICQPNMIDQDRPTAQPRKALYMQGQYRRWR